MMNDLMTGTLDERKGRLIIEVNDDVISTNVNNMRNEWLVILDTHKEKEWKALYLDLRNCKLVDSMGLNWLFAESLRLKQDNKEFVIRISSPAINRVMEFAGLDKIITLKYRRRKQTR